MAWLCSLYLAVSTDTYGSLFTDTMRVAMLCALAASACALRPAVRPVAAPRCAAAQMSLPSRRSVVAGAFSAVLFGAEAQARGAPAAAPAAKDPNAIDWAGLGLSREALGLPPDPNAKKEEAPKRGQRPKAASAAEKPTAVKPAAAKSKSKAAEKPKPAEKPAAKSAAKPAAKPVPKPAAKGGKAKPKNDLGLDLDAMGLTKEALGLEAPKKKAGPQKPPKPGEKPKAAPKPKPKPTRKQIEEKKKKDRSRAEKVTPRPPLRLTPRPPLRLTPRPPLSLSLRPPLRYTLRRALRLPLRRALRRALRLPLRRRRSRSRSPRSRPRSRRRRRRWSTARRCAPAVRGCTVFILPLTCTRCQPPPQLMPSLSTPHLSLPCPLLLAPSSRHPYLRRVCATLALLLLPVANISVSLSCRRPRR